MFYQSDHSILSHRIGEIFVIHTSNKEFVCKIHNELIQFNYKERNQLNIGKIFENVLTKQDILMNNKHMGRPQHHLPLGKCQLKPKLKKKLGNTSTH